MTTTPRPPKPRELPAIVGRLMQTGAYRAAIDADRTAVLERRHAVHAKLQAALADASSAIEAAQAEADATAAALRKAQDLAEAARRKAEAAAGTLQTLHWRREHALYLAARELQATADPRIAPLQAHVAELIRLARAEFGRTPLPPGKYLGEPRVVTNTAAVNAAVDGLRELQAQLAGLVEADYGPELGATLAAIRDRADALARPVVQGVLPAPEED